MPKAMSISMVQVERSILLLVTEDLLLEPNIYATAYL